MIPCAHVAGVPVEESLPALLPAAGLLLLGARLAVARLGRLLRQRVRLPTGHPPPGGAGRQR